MTLPYGSFRDEDFSKAIAEYKQEEAVGSPDSNFEERLLEELFLRYPTVYIVSADVGDSGKEHGGGPPYVVYVGETNDIRSRTRQHIELDPRDRTDWERLVRFMHSHQDRVCQYIIGDRHFNKSLTLDMENRLMGYMQSVDVVKLVMNRRTNAQDMYYTSDEFDGIFSMAWQTLHEMEPDLFPEEKAILDSAPVQGLALPQTHRRTTASRRNCSACAGVGHYSKPRRGFPLDDGIDRPGSDQG